MPISNPNNAVIKKYFLSASNTCHRQYEALRAFFYEKIPAEKVAQKFGYTVTAFYSLSRDFQKDLQKHPLIDPFFQTHSQGRPAKDTEGTIIDTIVKLRKQYLSVPEIKIILDAQHTQVSRGYISYMLKKEGFARLPRRDRQDKQESQNNIKDKIIPPEAKPLSFKTETFDTQNAGLLCIWPYIKEYGLHKIIQQSLYPETKVVDKLSSILSFLALKLSNIRRYSADDLWCMDRGMGLFACLNVLPKAAWFSSYSHRVTPAMNLDFLKKLHRLWKRKGLLSDTMNLDFTTIPYWGDDSHLENNWSGKRHKALVSMLAVLAQDPDSGIIDYGDTKVRHNKESAVVMEFLDFYRDGHPRDQSLKYLIFDSKFTTHQNLSKLDDKNIKFITIRRRGRDIVKHLDELPPANWKKIHVMKADGKGRNLKVFEQRVTNLTGYEKPVRQVAITGHGKIKPALLITNDFDIAVEELIKKYSRRWLVEKEISQQIEFFHLNRVSSSMVIKVDFDFTMTILAHNLYRIFATNLTGYAHQSDLSIFEKFLANSGDVEMTSKAVIVRLKKKRNLPAILSGLEKFQHQKIPWLGNRQWILSGSSTS